MRTGLRSLLKKSGKSISTIVTNGKTFLTGQIDLQIWALLVVFGMISCGAYFGLLSYKIMKERTTGIISIQSRTIQKQNQAIDSLTFKYNTLKFQSEVDPFIYYTPEEFDSPDKKGTNELMDSILLHKLALLNIYIDEELTVNSAYRTSARNRQAGGVHDSAHKSGEAVDIRVLNSAARFKVVQKAIELGIPRIGIHKRFIHLDVDTTKAHPAIWLY